MFRVLDAFRTHLAIKIAFRAAAATIPVLAMVAWLIVRDQRATVEDLVLERGKIAAIAGARAYASILQNGINSGAIKLDELIEPTYEEILYPSITEDGRSVENKRYHTNFDRYTDTHGIQEIQDAILASSSAFVYASGIDIRGYVPTPHQKYSALPTGDWERDRKVSRGKRKYNEPVILAAAGYMGSGTLVQDYHRDTGEMIWDVAAPIDIQGRHFGAFRVGVVRAQVRAWSDQLTEALIVLLSSTVALLTLVILIVTGRAIRPLTDIANAATRLSTTHDGSELKVPIRATSRDEVGQMARALERLRQSLLISWRRDDL
jgi:HAMP domain-containing protein